MKAGLWIITVSLLSGCATLSKEECLNADWFLIGFEDGNAGRAVGTISSHRKACAKADVIPNFAEYERGHVKGIGRYCTAETGFKLGNSGGSYNSACTGVGDGGFLSAFHAGKDRFDQRQQLNALATLLTDYASRQTEIADEIAHYTAEIISEASTAEDRAHYVQVLKNLHDERNTLKAQIEAAEYHIVIARAQLNELVHRQQEEGYP